MIDKHSLTDTVNLRKPPALPEQGSRMHIRDVIALLPKIDELRAIAEKALQATYDREYHDVPMRNLTELAHWAHDINQHVSGFKLL